jgi:hypothetical protein
MKKQAVSEELGRMARYRQEIKSFKLNQLIPLSCGEDVQIKRGSKNASISPEYAENTEDNKTTFREPPHS